MRTLDWQAPFDEADATVPESVFKTKRTRAAVVKTEERPGSAAAKARRLIRHRFVLFLAMMIQPASAIMTIEDRQSNPSGDRDHD